MSDDKNFTRTDEYIIKRLDRLENTVVGEIATLKNEAKHEGAKQGAKQGSIYAIILSILAAVIDRYFGQ